MVLEVNVCFNLLLVLALGSQFPSINGINCGTPKFQTASLPSQQNSVLGKRIVGGRDAVHGSWPWQVMLKKNGEVKCGGSILTNRIILTAAHCLYNEQLDAWEVYVGKYHKTNTDDTEVLHKIRKFIPHQQFNIDTLVNDIALLVVKEAIEFTDYVRPICLSPPRSKEKPQCFTTGWGYTKGTGHANVLKEVRLSRPLPRTCTRFLPQALKSRRNRNKVFCAGHLDADACYGDSGGPHSCKIKGKWYLTGIVSSGRGCGQPGWYGIYVNVPRYIGWINTIKKRILLETLLRAL